MIIILLVGILLLFLGLLPFISVVFYYPFKMVDIKNMDVKIIIKRESRLYSYLDVYIVKASYKYVVDGKEYMSEKVSFSDGLKYEYEDKAKKIVDRLKKINKCYCHVRNPKNSLLIWTFSIGDGDSTYAFIVSGALIVSLYFYLTYFFVW